MPTDLKFQKKWEHRYVFEAELPFPPGISFLPVGHYSATIAALPASLDIVNENGSVIASYPAPASFEPPYVMHLGLSGRHLPAIFVTKNGLTSLAYIGQLPEQCDVRTGNAISRWHVTGNGGAGTVTASMSAGVGQADVRWVTCGRQNQLYWENGRLFFTFSGRYYGAHQCIGSLDPKHFDIRFEGILLFDYDDGLLRNDLACHLFFDDETSRWRAWTSNFSTSNDALNSRAPGGLNAAETTENPLHGFHVLKSKSLNLSGMNEDPCGIYDSDARKWRLFVSEFTERGIKARMLESPNWNGPFVPLAGPVPEDSTGTTLQWMNGRLYCFSGSAEHAMHVYAYPDLNKLGRLNIQMPPWGETPISTPWGMMTTDNSRSWPCFAELPDGFPCKYLLLTMDRINFPGMPSPNWTYGGLHLFGAD